MSVIGALDRADGETVVWAIDEDDAVGGVDVTVALDGEIGAGSAGEGTTNPVDGLRLALALAVLDATTLDRTRIRRCQGDRCGLVYYDTSKNRSRRWCDMAACGNRAKAAAHYRRTKQGRTP